MYQQALQFLIYLIVLLVSFPVKAEPNLKIEYQFYDLYPLAKEDLGQEMDRQSPIVENGKKYRGYTSWNVYWQFYWQISNQKCRIDRVTTDLKVKYIMPKISDSHNVKPEVERVFNQYYSALLKHEQGHKDSGLYAAREIEQKLRSLGAYKDCKKLEQAANQTANQIVKKYNERDKNYDLKTDHGRLQGVNINY